MRFLNEKQMKAILEHYCNIDELQFRFENGQKIYKGSFFRDTEDFRFKLVDDGEKVLYFYVPFDGNTYMGESMRHQINEEVCFPQELLLICPTEVTDYTRKNSFSLYVYGWGISENTEDLNKLMEKIVVDHTLEEIFKF